jgi:hypothetical protein
MQLILFMLVAFCLIAIVVGRAVPRGRWLVVIGGTVLTFLAVLIAWWYALYFQLVPVYQMLAGMGIYRTEGALGALIFFGPPFVAALTILILASHRRRGHKGKPQ